MFDLQGVDRLTEWKKFRDQLETIDDPLTAVAEFWSRAPFVNPFLNPSAPADWPDPWHLILDNRLDNLAIVLGMLYTIKLTNRFMKSHCEIHKSISDDGRDPVYYLVVDNEFLLDSFSREVKKFSEVQVKTSLVWSKDDLK